MAPSASPLPPVVRPADGLWAVLLFLGLAMLLSAFLPLPRSLAHASPTALLALYGATVAAEAGAALLVLRRRLPRFLATRYAWSARAIPQGLLWGLGLSVTATGLAWAEHPWLPVHSNNPFVTNSAVAHLPLLPLTGLILLITVGAPVAEEALFRGLLFGGWQTRIGLGPAALGSAILFGLAHVQIALLLPITAVGVGLALLTARTRSLWPSTVAHATFNLVAVLFAFGFH